MICILPFTSLRNRFALPCKLILYALFSFLRTATALKDPLPSRAIFNFPFYKVIQISKLGCKTTCHLRPFAHSLKWQYRTGSTVFDRFQKRSLKHHTSITNLIVILVFEAIFEAKEMHPLANHDSENLNLWWELLAAKKSFYLYCGLLAVLNLLQSIGSGLLYYNVENGLWWDHLRAFIIIIVDGYIIRPISHNVYFPWDKFGSHIWPLVVNGYSI